MNGKISSSEVINRVRPKLGAIPGAMTFLQAGQDVRIGGRQSNAQYQYTIQSENLQDLVKWGPIVLAEMRKLRGFTDVNSDQQNAGLQASLTYDRQTAARLGISAQLIDDTLYDAFGQRQVSTMFTSLNQYHVVMEVDPQYWQSPTGLDAIYIRPNTTAANAALSVQVQHRPVVLASRDHGFQLLSLSAPPTPIPTPAIASPSPDGWTNCRSYSADAYFPALYAAYTSRPCYAIGDATTPSRRPQLSWCSSRALRRSQQLLHRRRSHIDEQLAHPQSHCYFSANSNCERRSLRHRPQ